MTYGWYSGSTSVGGAQTLVRLLMSGIKFDVNTATIATADNGTTLLALRYTGNVEVSTKGIVVGGNIERSFIEADTIVNITGTLSNSHIVGLPANWTIGTNAGTNNFQSIYGGVAGTVAFSGTTASVSLPTSARLSAASHVDYVVTFSVNGSVAGNCWVSTQNSSGFTITASASNTETVSYNVAMY